VVDDTRVAFRSQASSCSAWVPQARVGAFEITASCRRSFAPAWPSSSAWCRAAGGYEM